MINKLVNIGLAKIITIKANNKFSFIQEIIIIKSAEQLANIITNLIHHKYIIIRLFVIQILTNPMLTNLLFII